MPLLAPCFPLLPRGPVPSGSPAFFFGCLSCRAHRCSRAPCVCPLLLSGLPLPRRPVPSPPVSQFLPSSPPIRCHSEGPVFTFPSAVTAFAVHSLVCATCVLYPCPSLLSLPLSPGVVSHPHPALSVLLLSPILVLSLRYPTLSPSRTPWVL